MGHPDRRSHPVARHRHPRQRRQEQEPGRAGRRRLCNRGGRPSPGWGECEEGVLLASHQASTSVSQAKQSWRAKQSKAKQSSAGPGPGEQQIKGQVVKKKKKEK